MRTKLAGCFVGLLWLLYFPVIALAQPYHRLAARDFAGTPDDDGYVAYTNCYVSYSYQPVRHNGAYTVDFKVLLTLNTNRSWLRFNQITTRNMLLDILRHEQGHYDIAYLMKNELYSVLSSHRYTANYQAEIAFLFKQVDTKYHKMNMDYEAQTQHMANAENQQKWNTWFSRQLDNAPVAYNNKAY